MSAMFHRICPWGETVACQVGFSFILGDTSCFVCRDRKWLEISPAGTPPSMLCTDLAVLSAAYLPEGGQTSVQPDAAHPGSQERHKEQSLSRPACWRRSALDCIGPPLWCVGAAGPSGGSVEVRSLLAGITTNCDLHFICDSRFCKCIFYDSRFLI